MPKVVLWFFNVIAGNCDDHTKNFAFKMDDAGTRKLAPAFDVCHAYRPGCMWVSQQSLSVNGKRIDITPDDLLHVTKMMSIKKVEQIMKQINRVVNHWPKYAQQVKVNKDLLAAIGKTLLNFK